MSELPIVQIEVNLDQIKINSVCNSFSPPHVHRQHAKKLKIWQMTLPIFMFIYMLREKCETNQCKYRDCGLRKRRLWKTDDALALALPEREPDKMQFVKQYKEV